MSSERTTLGKYTDIRSSFNNLQQWATEVVIQVRDKNETYHGLVGEETDQHCKSYRLYSNPLGPECGTLGTISLHSQYGQNDCDVTFKPSEKHATQTATEDIQPVEHMIVDYHTRNKQLNAVLPILRDALTDATWIKKIDANTEPTEQQSKITSKFFEEEHHHRLSWIPVKGDTSYEDWLNMTNRIAEFVDDTYTDANIAIDENDIRSSSILNNLPRYPLNSSELLSVVTPAFTNTDSTPEAFRTALIDYACKHLNPNVPVNLEPSSEI